MWPGGSLLRQHPSDRDRHSDGCCVQGEHLPGAYSARGLISLSPLDTEVSLEVSFPQTCQVLVLRNTRKGGSGKVRLLHVDSDPQLVPPAGAGVRAAPRRAACTQGHPQRGDRHKGISLSLRQPVGQSWVSP